MFPRTVSYADVIFLSNIQWGGRGGEIVSGGKCPNVGIVTRSSAHLMGFNHKSMGESVVG